jgi:hypothetical protein
MLLFLNFSEFFVKILKKNGTKGLVLSIQAVLMKNLIKRGYTDINGKPVIDR